MVCPEPASRVPAACPVAMSPIKVARAVGPVGAVVVVGGKVVVTGGRVVNSGIVEVLSLDVACDLLGELDPSTRRRPMHRPAMATAPSAASHLLRVCLAREMTDGADLAMRVSSPMK